MKVRELLPSFTTSCRSVSCLPCVGCQKRLIFTHNVLIQIDLQEGVKEKNGNRLTRACEEITERFTICGTPALDCRG